LFRLDPEIAHNISLQLLSVTSKFQPASRLLSNFYNYNDSRLATSVFGLRFDNPIGVAAGYDKNAIAIDGLTMLGVGHVEVGTITPISQCGNQRPRIWRLSEDSALINRMGFPNHGMDIVASRLSKPRSIRLGLNIGKGANTDIRRSANDYIEMIYGLQHLVDYLVVNISSPNTPGLRSLQGHELLNGFLLPVMECHSEVCPNRPLLIKISPDITVSDLDNLLDIVIERDVSGVIATNSSTSRIGVSDPRYAKKGGLSGKPLHDRSTNIIRHIYKQTCGDLPIIGVGGIDNTTTALDKIKAGASLVQVYTGLVYRGPGLIQEINHGIAKELENLGVNNIMDIVGVSI
tara:strand:+ start:499 stop:1539 length:1041 start_codon:yes stop_codon:yes gene_type:complete